MSDAPIARRVMDLIRQQVRAKVVNLVAVREGNAYAAKLQQSTAARADIEHLNAAHAIYVRVQHQMSVMAEQLMELTEMQAFARLLQTAQDDYMPSWPPMSPITTSFFWCWATLDATVNAHRETLGSVILAVATELGMHPTMLTLMRAFLDSRMGVYRVGPHSDARVQLMDLVTGQSCFASCDSGYAGEPGELWFTRVLPPAQTGDHVVFTSPYVLLSPDANGWSNYFDRIAAKDAARSRSEALKRHFKRGASRRYWPEFVFEAYVNHEPGAIYLKGLPDVAASRPQSPHYVRTEGT